MYIVFQVSAGRGKFMRGIDCRAVKCQTSSYGDGRISPGGPARAIRLNKVLAGSACQNLIPLLSLARLRGGGRIVFSGKPRYFHCPRTTAFPVLPPPRRAAW
jgi:hypothetical protein